jgi:hypothetical protein
VAETGHVRRLGLDAEEAVVPIWTVADALPEEIASAIVCAVPIGIANAFVVEASWKVNCDDAAVSMPTTCPWLLRSGPPESPG